MVEVQGDIKFRKLFVGNLWHGTNETCLINYFRGFGVVAAAHVINDRDGRTRCFGFVTFANPEAATAACLIRFHFIDGRTVNCNLAAFPLQDEEPFRPRMNFGPPPPHCSPFPFFPYPLPYANPYRFPNYPMPMYGVPPVYPIHGPGSVPPVHPYYPMPMYGVPPVYRNGQPLNQPATFNNPMHRPGQMHVAPPAYPYGQTSLPVTTLARSQNGRPMYGPRSMTGLQSVHEICQSSGSNVPATDNTSETNLATTSSTSQNGRPMYGPGSMIGLPSVNEIGPSSGSNGAATDDTSETTLATTSNSSQNGRPMYGPRSMTGLASVNEIDQSSGSNGASTDNYPIYDLPSEFPYEYD